MCSTELSSSFLDLQAALRRELGDELDVRACTHNMPFSVVGCAAPRSEAATRELVRWCGMRKQALVPTGGGTRLQVGAPPSRPVLLLSTEHLRQVVDWDEGNATVEAQAGVLLADLNALVMAGRQFVPLDDAHNGSMSTLGGAVATNAYGPSKFKWGAPRDLVTGLHAVLSDGRLVQAGAKVVKNVAGYDLPKLFTGSWGTLGVLTRVTLRLRAQESARLRWECAVSDWDEATILCARLLSNAFEPTWVCVTWQKGTLHVRAYFEGGVAALQAQRARLLSEGVCSDLDDETVSGVPPQVATERWLLRAGLPLSSAGAWARRCAERGAAHVLWEAGTGTVRASWHELEPEGVRALRTWAQEMGGFLVLERTPQDSPDAELVWGAPSSSFALMRALKTKFDPAEVCAPGRFVGGL